MPKIVKSKKKVKIKAKAKPAKPSPLIEKLSKLIDKFGMSIFENPGTLPLFFKQEKIKPKEVTSAAISEAARLYHDQMEQLKHRIAKLKGSYNGRRLMIENGEVVNYRPPTTIAPDRVSSTPHSDTAQKLDDKRTRLEERARRKEERARIKAERKNRPPAERDVFGNKVDSQVGKINAHLVRGPITLDQILKKTKGMNPSSVRSHLNTLTKKGLLKLTKKGYEAQVKAEPKKKTKTKRGDK